MNVSDTLNKAADLIEERGWTTGSGWLGGAGEPLCAEGAIAAALGMDLSDPEAPQGLGSRYFTTFIHCPAYQAVSSHLNEPTIFSWNDRRAPSGDRLRTATEVVEVLRATALIEASREKAVSEASA